MSCLRWTPGGFGADLPLRASVVVVNDAAGQRLFLVGGEEARLVNLAQVEL